ncbi:M48 family metalloprotease [Kitasatospora sp. NPDC059722]|uniref:M48 family metalloprotease n=1 Tax=Kitasatospora sp. NPDC059722 TaxID=3346925 RepID=UPI003695066C
MRAQPRFDERAVGAGTTMRFVLLVALLVVSSGSMLTQVIYLRAISPSQHGAGCLLAAGGDPYDTPDSVLLMTGLNQPAAYEACVARYEPSPAWWLAPACAVLLTAVAGVLFLLLPRWKARSARCVPLAVMDADGAIARELAALAASAGLARMPRVVVDPTAVASGSAVVFGWNGRPTIRLAGGLLSRRIAEPDRFRAVLLHELAHVRNGDVTLTYATIALWRVYVLLVMLPYTAWFLADLPALVRAVDWPQQVPGVVRSVTLSVAMAVLVYLARSDVLRSREIHADLTAVRWGAPPHGWAGETTAPVGGAFRRAAGSFAELWRAHPRFDVRRHSLTDPEALFDLRALPMFLTGAAAALFGTQVDGYLVSHGLDGVWFQQAAEVVAAGFVTGVAAVAIWRAVLYAVATGRRPPSGVRSGLFLGVGMAAAEAVAGGLTVGHWAPERPWALVLIILAGAVYGCWTAQCALLWSRVWTGRSIVPAMLVCLAAGCAAMSCWFVWWHREGATIALGAAFNPGSAYRLFPVADVSRSTSAALVATMQTVADPPLALFALLGLWVVPLLAWVVRPPAGVPGWLAAAVPGDRLAGVAAGPRKPLPQLRRLLVAVLVGGLTGWAGLIAATAWLHTRMPEYEDRVLLSIMTYLVLWAASLVLAAAVAAGVASAVSHRYRLLVAVITAELAVLLAAAATFLTESSGGCVEALRTFYPSCSWHPGGTWDLLSLILGPVLVLGGAAAPVAASLVWAVRRLRPAARETAPAVTRAARAGRRLLTVRRMGVGLACTVAVAVSSVLWSAPSQGDSSADRTPPSVDQAPPAPRTRAFQVVAWWTHGGEELSRRYMAVTRDFGALLENGHGAVEGSAVRPHCERIRTVATDAAAYFRVPEPQAQLHWQEFVAHLTKSGQDCDGAVRDNDGDLLMSALKEAATAGEHANQVGRRIIAVGKEGGL